MSQLSFKPPQSLIRGFQSTKPPALLPAGAVRSLSLASVATSDPERSKRCFFKARCWTLGNGNTFVRKSWERQDGHIKRSFGIESFARNHVMRIQSRGLHNASLTYHAFGQIRPIASGPEAQSSNQREVGEANTRSSESQDSKQSRTPNLQNVRSGARTRVSTTSSFADESIQLDDSSIESNEWKIQKRALNKKFPSGWSPRKKLSPDALESIRELHAQDPYRYSTPVLSAEFGISPEAIRRILKSKWRPSEAEEEQRRARWEKRGQKIWSEMAEKGLKPPKRWRSSAAAEELRGDSSKGREDHLSTTRSPCSASDTTDDGFIPLSERI